MSDGQAPRYFPVFLDLRGRLVVVLGGGAAAARKVRTLSRYGADVAVISPDITPELVQLEADGLVSLEERAYVRGDLAGATLVLCLDVDDEVARAVTQEAVETGALVNVAGDPELSAFLLPSVVDREPLQIAVTTQGAAPELTRRLRAELKAAYGPAWRQLVPLVSEIRAQVAEQASDRAEFDAAMAALDHRSLLERIESGQNVVVRKVAAELLDRIRGETVG